MKYIRTMSVCICACTNKEVSKQIHARRRPHSLVCTCPLPSRSLQSCWVSGDGHLSPVLALYIPLISVDTLECSSGITSPGKPVWIPSICLPQAGQGSHRSSDSTDVMGHT